MRAFLVVFLVFLGSLTPFVVASDSSQDEVIRQALEAFNARDYNLFEYEELGRALDNEHGGVVYLALISRETGERIPDIVEWLVVVPEGGGWRVLLPGDAGYRAAIDSLPTEVSRRLDDTRYRIRANPRLVSSRELAGYQLPWEDGRWATVTRSFTEHGRGRIDFDMGGSVTAAKDGIIVYANDSNSANSYTTGAWWHWNVVIIEHGEHEYSLYGHLAPGSLPAWIREGCSDDYNQSNCQLEVRAGDVIAQEGNTGYSSSAHLHIEFGQSYGIVGYASAPDVVTYTGYLYAEQNVGFSGYAPPQVAAWSYGQVIQAAHHPVPVNTELVRNGSFDNATVEWTPSGQVNWNADEGIMRFLRLNTAEPPAWASFYQELGYGAPANGLFEVRFLVGNDSPYPKTVTVSLRNAAGSQYGTLTCEVDLPANTPLQPRTIFGQVDDTWANMRLEFSVNPPDSAPAALIDEVSVRRVEGTLLTATDCDA